MDTILQKWKDGIWNRMASNFKELFMAIEREQEERGNL